MRKRFPKKALTVLLTVALMLSFVPAVALGEGFGQALYTNTRHLGEGLYYTNTITTNSSGKRVETFALETTAGEGAHPIVLARDKINSTMDINGMVEWAVGQGMNVYGAVNADFFYGSSNYPLGGVIENGRYVTDVNGESMLAFGEDDAWVVRDPRVTMKLLNHGVETPETAPGDGGETDAGEAGEESGTGEANGADGENGAGEDAEVHTNAGTVVTVDHLNKVRTNSGGLFLYTSDYHGESTCTSRKGWAVRFRVLEGTLTVNGQVELEVAEVIPEGKDYPIGDGYMVLTAPSDSAGHGDDHKYFAVGDRVTLTAESLDESLPSALWGVGCGDVLAEGGKLTDMEGWDKDITDENPRTGVGIKPDGSIIACVIDGRQSGYSGGALLEEMAEDLLGRGCVTVVNLDGGGSSVMSVRLPGQDMCAVIDRPSSGKPRNCGDYILFVSDSVPDAVPATLHLEEDGAFVLAGSKLPVNFTATDAAGAPAELGGAVAVTAGLGQYEEGFYTAGETAGVDRLELSCEDTGASGYGSVHVVDRLDTMAVIDAATGRAPYLSDLESGAQVQLMVTGTYLTRDVAVDAGGVEFSSSDGLGEFSEDGCFTLTAAPGASGEITVTAGGITAAFPVSVKPGFTDVAGHWAESYINDLLDKGVVNGMGDHIFSPDGTVNRCDFVLMLWRTMQSPVFTQEGEEVTSPFEDVAEDAYFFDATVWASTIGLVNGVGDGRFDPYGKLTREQAFTVLYRLLSLLRLELPAPDPSALEIFEDAGEIDGYALDAFMSLTSYGLIGGSGGKCSPLRDITRAETAKILDSTLY